ncbi:MFS transporter [Marinobacterium nitratireducens]|uniref:MFS transporter n=1 Tax=Marinobacterium nitratireducens TaxID=518897 RepID=A0A917ZBE6_9GAMM|nr:MFS transporter [Marinobacterium nitratireducens]GGO78251.1 MFS transporter [Marinobacterium nitratireducens]
MIEAGSRAFWQATLALCLGSVMIFANVYVTQPLLPMIAEDFGISPLQAGWSFTVTTLTLGLSLLVYGPLSDALGRRGIILLTMAGVTLTTLALSFTQSYGLLLGLRALQGFFLGGLPAIAIAYMGDEFSRKALLLAVGFYISGNTLGGVGGRLVGGFVGEHFGWSQAFMAMACVSALLLAAVALLLPPSRGFSAKPLRPALMLRDLGDHLRNPLLLGAYLIGGLNFFIFINQYSYATFMLAEAPYGLSAQFLGMLFLTYLSGTVGSALSGRIAQRLSQPLCMALGVLLLMCGTLVTLIPSLTAIIAGFLINSFGFFFAHSTASSWVSRHAEHARASASSLYLLFYYLGASCGGFYLAPFWHGFGWAGVVVASLLVLTVTLMLSLLLYRSQARQPVPA